MGTYNCGFYSKNVNFGVYALFTDVNIISTILGKKRTTNMYL